MKKRAQYPCKGFTLVELAIVMIIIGLLIGGILKGQELVANAKVAATITEIKGIDSATSTFQDKYNALPGDMLNVAARLANCSAAYSCIVAAANGDGRVTNPDGTVFGVVPMGEALAFFPQLAAADLITGVDPTIPMGSARWGGNWPAAPIGGGFHVGYLPGSAIPHNALGIAAANVRAGHYLALHNAPGFDTPSSGAVPNTGIITPNQAYRIDAKLDDGSPVSGSVFPAGADACINGNAYNEVSDQDTCNLYIRFHQ